MVVLFYFWVNTEGWRMDIHTYIYTQYFSIYMDGDGRDEEEGTKDKAISSVRNLI